MTTPRGFLALQAEHGHEITLKTRGEENVFTLQSNNPALPLAKLKEKFRLEAFNDFHARAGRGTGPHSRGPGGGGGRPGIEARRAERLYCDFDRFAR